MDSFFVQDPFDNSNHPENQDSRSAEHSTQPAHGLHARGLHRKPSAFVGMAMAAFIVVGLAASIWSVGVSQELRQQAAGERTAITAPGVGDNTTDVLKAQEPMTLDEWMAKIKAGQMFPPTYLPEAPPPVPPMAADAPQVKVFVVAYGGNQHVIPPEFTNQNEFILTNDEYIPWLEHALEWSTVAGNYNGSPSGQLARINITFPYQYVQFTAEQAPVIVNPPQDEYQLIVDTPNPAYPGGQSICQMVNAGLIDEVWFFHNNTANFADTIMAGPDYNNTISQYKAFPTNHEPVLNSSCTKGVHLMGINYGKSYETRVDQYPPVFNGVLERAPSMWHPLHAFAVRFEHSYAYLLDNNPRYYYPNGVNNPGWADPDGYYDAFQFDRTHGYQNMSPPPILPPQPRSCGNADFPANSQNTQQGKYYYKASAAYPQYMVKSDCTNDPNAWNPQHTFVPTTENVDCTLWGCWQEKYHIWWMQHFPNKTNTYCMLGGSAMPDWWRFMYKNEIMPGQGSCNPPSPVPTPSPSPSPVPTPSPSPSPVPTPSPSPTPVPTPSPSPSPVPTPSPSPTPVPTPSPSPSPIPTPTPVPTPTPPPATLTTSQGCQAGKATIYTNWTTIPGATSYSLEKCQGTTCTPTPYATTSVPYYVDQAKFVLGSSYRYRVRGYYGTLPGSYSNVVTTTFRVSCSITP